MDRREFLKAVGGFSALASLGVFAGEPTSNATALQRTLTRKRLFSGFDGKTCKIQLSVAADGEGLGCLPFGQQAELANGDVLVPCYYDRPDPELSKRWSSRRSQLRSPVLVRVR